MQSPVSVPVISTDKSRAAAKINQKHPRRAGWKTSVATFGRIARPGWISSRKTSADMHRFAHRDSTTRAFQGHRIVLAKFQHLQTLQSATAVYILSVVVW